jgi:hypothetical protein
MDADSRPNAADIDVLDHGEAAGRRWWLVFGTLALLLVVGAAWLDARERAREFHQLVRCAQDGQDAIRYADGSTAAMSQYVRPALNTAAPESVHAGLLQLIEQAAANGSPAVERARAGCVTVSPAAWHGDLNRARAAYVDYLEAWSAYLDAAAADGREIFVEHPELSEHLAVARDALTASARSTSDADLARTRLGDLLGSRS